VACLATGYTFTRVVTTSLELAGKALVEPDALCQAGQEANCAVVGYKELANTVRAKKEMVLQVAKQDIEVHRKQNATFLNVFNEPADCQALELSLTQMRATLLLQSWRQIRLNPQATTYLNLHEQIFRWLEWRAPVQTVTSLMWHRWHYTKPGSKE